MSKLNLQTRTIIFVIISVILLGSSDKNIGTSPINVNYDNNLRYDAVKTKLSDGNVLIAENNGLVISNATGDQLSPQLCCDGTGGTIITWQDKRFDGGDIYAQLLSYDSETSWDANGTVICNATDIQKTPQLISDQADGAIITWIDNRSGSGWDIYAQHINSQGEVTWTENGVSICTAANNQETLKICDDGAGGAIITWRDYRTGSDGYIYAQRVDSTGNIRWTANGVAICTQNGGNDAYVNLCVDGEGGAIITWGDERNGAFDRNIYVQRINASGELYWTTNGVAICTASICQYQPNICIDENYGAIITWHDYRKGWSDSDIFAQRINSTGHVQWTANGVGICTEVNHQKNPRIVSDGNGGAIIKYNDFTSNTKIFAQRINSSGNIQWTIPVAICDSTADQGGSNFFSDGDGGAVFTWYDDRAGDHDINLQWVNATGNNQWTASGNVLCNESNDQINPQICGDENGVLTIAWQDYRTGFDYDIYGTLANLSSDIIIEDSDDFLEGTMYNLTINDNGYLSLEKEIVDDSWSNITRTGPSSRGYYGMVYDSTSAKVILFGGYNGTTRFGDTWVYDLTINTWTEKTPSNSPSARYGHDMVYDSTSKKVILFGGDNGSRPTDTWVYDLASNTWTKKTPLNSPSGRHQHSMVYDSTAAKVILFGGWNGTTRFGDTWVYDLASNTWTEKTPSKSPSGRFWHSIVYDSTSAKVILFGGRNSSGYLNDTWIYDLASNTWTEKTPSNRPNAIAAHSMTYDSTSDKVVLFGGYNGTHLLNDTWSYDLSSDTWTEKTPSNPPSARSYHSMVYDSISAKIILFGGYEFAGYIFSDTWVFDLPSNTWTPMYPSPKPSARRYHSMVYDSNSSKVIMFGGMNSTSRFDDTWVYDLGSNTWTPMTPSVKPSARHAHSMVYDSNSDKVILFGGYNGSSNLADTWVYDLGSNTWTPMTPSVKPNAIIHHSMVYDSNSDKVILFGGYNGSSNLADTWIYDLGSNTWTLMTPSVKPNARASHSMVYDSTSNKVILFSGWNGTNYFADTWVYDLGSNTWTPMSPSVKPNARHTHSMVYNSTSDKVILFGGYNGSFYLADTWVYDYGFNTWTEKTLSTKPSRRTGHIMVYDSTSDKVILFGGADGSSNLADTWVYPSHKYYQSGRFESKITSFDSIYNVTGELTWNPLTQPEDAELRFQIGLSNTTSDEDFRYTNYYTSTFTFGGFGQYLRFRAVFESNDVNQFLTPLLKKVIIYYTIPATEPNPPQSLSATAGDNFVELSWSAPSDDGGSPITGYHVYRGTTTGNYFYLGTATGTSFNDTTAIGGTTYYYVVAAINAIGESTFSNEVSATPTTPATTQISTTTTQETTSETTTTTAPTGVPFTTTTAISTTAPTLVVDTPTPGWMFAILLLIIVTMIKTKRKIKRKS